MRNSPSPDFLTQPMERKLLPRFVEVGWSEVPFGIPGICTLCVGAPACPSAAAAEQTIAANELTKEKVFFITTSSKMAVNVSHAPPGSPSRQIRNPPETWCEVKPASARGRHERTHRARHAHRQQQARWDRLRDYSSNSYRRKNPPPIPLRFHACHRCPTRLAFWSLQDESRAPKGQRGSFRFGRRRFPWRPLGRRYTKPCRVVTPHIGLLCWRAPRIPIRLLLAAGKGIRRYARSACSGIHARAGRS